MCNKQFLKKKYWSMLFVKSGILTLMIGNEGIIDDDTLDASCNDILNNADADDRWKGSRWFDKDISRSITTTAPTVSNEKH